MSSISNQSSPSSSPISKKVVPQYNRVLRDKALGKADSSDSEEGEVGVSEEKSLGAAVSGLLRCYDDNQENIRGGKPVGGVVSVGGAKSGVTVMTMGGDDVEVTTCVVKVVKVPTAVKATSKSGVDPRAEELGRLFMGMYGEEARGCSTRQQLSGLYVKMVKVGKFMPTAWLEDIGEQRVFAQVLFAIAHGMKSVRVSRGVQLNWNPTRDNNGDKLVVPAQAKGQVSSSPTLANMRAASTGLPCRSWGRGEHGGFYCPHGDRCGGTHHDEAGVDTRLYEGRGGVLIVWRDPTKSPSDRVSYYRDLRNGVINSQRGSGHNGSGLLAWGAADAGAGHNGSGHGGSPRGSGHNGSGHKGSSRGSGYNGSGHKGSSGGNSRRSQYRQ